MPIADQIDHALGFVAIVEEQAGGAPQSVLDLGTGGGMPGLVLASCWPDTRVVLMDANQRRTAFLQEVVEAWPAGAVVRWCGAGLRSWGDRGAAGSLRCRDLPFVRSPAATAECGSSFLTVGGAMVVSEPPDADLRERWPATGLDQLGLAPVATLRPVQRFGYQALTKVELPGPPVPSARGDPDEEAPFLTRAAQRFGQSLMFHVKHC